MEEQTCLDCRFVRVQTFISSYGEQGRVYRCTLQNGKVMGEMTEHSEPNLPECPIAMYEQG